MLSRYISAVAISRFIMNRMKRIGIALAFLVSTLLLSMPQGVAASPSFMVSIHEAYYADLDADAIEDDIIIYFSCFIPENTRQPGRSDFYFTLTLPSGHQHYALVTVLGKYSELRLALYWFDSAWEEGWYNVQLDAFAYGMRRGYAMDTYDFDPPGTGNGDPSIKVTFW